MTEIIIGGEAFNVIVEGPADAPAIVLAHSLGTNMHVFDKQVAALKHHFRVVRYDLRGHGGTVVSEGPYTIAHFGHDALAMLDALNLEKVHWIGLGVGGSVGQWLLGMAPDRIDRAVLANTAAQMGGAEIWNERIRTAQEKGMDALAPSVIDNWFTRHFREHHPEQVRRLEEGLLATSAEGYAATAAAIRDADSRGALAAITHPVLVVVGRHDPVAPPGMGALIASTIDGAKLVTMDAAELTPVEAADAFNAAVLDFLIGERDTATDRGTEDRAPEEPTLEPAPHKPRKLRVPRPKPVAKAAAHANAPPPAAESGPGPIAASETPTPTPIAAHAAPRRRPAKKVAARRTPAKRLATKEATTKEAAGKKAARKATARKTAAKRPIRTAAKKYAAKHAATKKRSVKNLARKSAAKKAARKAVVKRAAPKKALFKKSASKKSASKRSASKKSAPKKSASTKSAPKKMPLRRVPGRRRSPHRR